MKRWKDMNKDERAKVLAVVGVAVGGIAVGVGGCMTAKYLGKMINNKIYPPRGLHVFTEAVGENHESFSWKLCTESKFKPGTYKVDYSGVFDTHDGAIKLFKELIEDAEQYKAQIAKSQFNEALAEAVETIEEKVAES